MLFEGRGARRRRFPSRRRRHVATLRVSMRRDRRKKAKSYRWNLAVAGLLVLAVSGTAGWFGLRAVGQLLFSGNARFTIKHLEIRNGGVAVADFIRGSRNIREGTNLFAFNARAVRREFLAGGPNFKTMAITRRLPDTLVVSVEERVPLARVGRWGHFVVDNDGCVFGARPGSRSLPVITGYKTEGLTPGERVEGIAIAALQVLEVCDNPRLGLHVVSVDVSRTDYLVIHFAGRKSFRFDWGGMGQKSVESRKRLLKKLGRLARTMQSAQASRHSGFDATYGNMIIGL